MLKTLTMLLGINKEDKKAKALVSFALDKAIDIIKNYCNISEIPKELERICVSMAMDVYRTDNLGSAEAGVFVKTLTEGDRSTTFGMLKASQGCDDEAYIKPYINQLNRYRRLVW